MELTFKYNYEYRQIKLDKIEYCLTNKIVDKMYYLQTYDGKEIPYLDKIWLDVNSPPEKLYIYLLTRVDSFACIYTYDQQLALKVFTDELTVYQYLYENGIHNEIYDCGNDVHYDCNSVGVMKLRDGKYEYAGDIKSIMIFETPRRTLKFLKVERSNDKISKFPGQSDEQFQTDYQIYQKLKNRIPDEEELAIDDYLIEKYGLKNIDKIHHMFELLSKEIEFDLVKK